jgi:hypothetical protein
MSDDIATRVRYYERQFLRTQDFTDEQAYHLIMRHRHNIAHHRWGIVYGLEVQVDTDGRLSVQPGMAVDGYGRELIVSDLRQIDPREFDTKDSDELDVSLAYRQIIVGQSTAVRSCGDQSQADRVQEYPQIRLDAPDPSFADPRAPRGVPSGDRAFDPSRTPPADADWPVLLGRLKRSRESADKPWVYTAVAVEIPYAGLIGEAIHAPSGRARVQIGAEQPDDPRRFAMFVQDPAAPDAPVAPALEIDAIGKIDMRGDAMLYGDLKIAGGALEFGVGPARARLARPWQIYHHVETRPPTSAPQAGLVPPAPAQQEFHELRIEMPGAGNGQVAIGAWSEDDKAFKPCLTIANDCTVTVHGDLIIEGKLEETLNRPEAQQTQAVRALAVSNAISALTSATFGQSALGPERELMVAERLIDSDVGRRAILGIIDAKRDRVEQFVRIQLRSDDARAIIVPELLEKPNGQADVIAELRKNDSVRSTIVSGLIENDEGIETLAETLNQQLERAAQLARFIRENPRLQRLLELLRSELKLEQPGLS